MIARLRGAVAAVDADGLVLDVHGVGYRLLATQSAVRLAEAGGEVALETHLHVREDALQLFGFASAAERELFERLLSVTGVGPKMALAVVSAHEPAAIHRAIVLEDVALFQTVPGIGRKLAQRVVLELRERVGPPPLAVSGVPAAGAATNPHLVARDALVELGYSVGEAEERLAGVDPDLSAEERVRLALKAA